MSTEHDTLAPESAEIPDVNRRQFLGGAGAAVIGVSAGALAFAPKSEAAGAAAAEVEGSTIVTGDANVGRTLAAYNIRVNMAKVRRDAPHPQHRSNGDEGRYPNRIGSYSKGLPHNEFGEVSASAYSAFLKAVQTGSPRDFEAMPLGGPRFQTSPQAGMAFDLQGYDAQAVTAPPAPKLASAEEAGEAVELYWMALLRDLHFNEYEGNSDVQAAVDDLNGVSVFKGPKEGGVVTPQTLFRDPFPGCTVGPYVSQFMLLPTPFGAEFVDRRARVFAEGDDHMTTFENWLTVQNGGVNESSTFDSERRYLRNARDLSAWVQMDVLFQAYFNACLILGTPPNTADVNSGGIGCPVNKGNPYGHSLNQAGFATFGPPAMKGLLCEVATRGLKATWFQKWFLHRRLRPEAFGGLVHLQKTQNRYPGILHNDVLNSTAVEATFDKYGSYLHPMAFPEGSPTHPSYTAGHATVAGASVTILKALFDESFVIQNPVVASHDGLSLEPYDGPELTVGGELNKLASNIATGRNLAGVHWRSDSIQSMLLGEKIAIGILEDQRVLYNENRGGFFKGYTFTKFNGETITV